MLWMLQLKDAKKCLQSRWKSFAKKKKVQIDVTLKETIDQIRVFLEPLEA